MGFVDLYTGRGAGKTVNALGLSFCAVGHKRKVVVIQFSKWWKNLGNIRFRKCLKPTIRFASLVVKIGMD